MKTNQTSVLIISDADRLCTSLRVLLRTNPVIMWIGGAPNMHSGLELIAVHQPDVILIDAGLANDEGWQVLKMIKSAYPIIRCVMLSHSLAQQKIASGTMVDAILDDGFNMEKLFQAIGRNKHTQIIDKSKDHKESKNE